MTALVRRRPAPSKPTITAAIGPTISTATTRAPTTIGRAMTTAATAMTESPVSRPAGGRAGRPTTEEGAPRGLGAGVDGRHERQRGSRHRGDAGARGPEVGCNRVVGRRTHLRSLRAGRDRRRGPDRTDDRRPQVRPGAGDRGSEPHLWCPSGRTQPVRPRSRGRVRRRRRSRRRRRRRGRPPPLGRRRLSPSRPLRRRRPRRPRRRS